MKAAVAMILAIGAALSGCAPYPVSVAQAPMPLTAYWDRQAECAQIYGEIARQQRIAASSGVMSTILVEGAVRLNAANVIYGLETRAALLGCRA